LISKGRVIRTGLFFALANFFITTAIGLLLRYHYYHPIDQFADRYWIHAHSHVGFLGWAFMAIITFSFSMQLPKSSGLNRYMYRILIYFQLAVLGMLVTFPFMGYAAPSIFFSTFHMVLSIVFVVWFFRNSDGNDLSVKYLKAALIFMLISSVGPLALGPLMVLEMKGTPVYDLAVYFYLHFQYNAWFTLAIFGLFIKLIEQLGFPIKDGRGRLILHLLIYASILSLALSALGFETFWYVRAIGMAGAVLQIIAGYLFLVLVLKNLHLARSVSNRFANWFFGAALFSWLMKIMLQFISAIPVVTEFAFYNRDAIMTYLHLTFLGFVSCFMFGLMIIKKYLSVESRIARSGYVIFFLGVLSMEVTLGIRSFPQFLSLEAFETIKIALLLEAILLVVSLIFILFYGFIIPKRKLKHR
jgi:hypothetical protein